jgi:AcrR family transcriptional regulator
VSAPRSETAIVLLEAAQRCLQRHGVAGLSTRKVAEEAGMPLSQIHYHLGSKRGLLLELFAYQNEKLLARQEAMYARPLPLWQRWMQACDYLDEDVASGYVRVLQEMIAAGWSDPEIGFEVRRNLRGWGELLTGVAAEAAERIGGLGPLVPAEAAALAGLVFLGAEAVILLGFKEGDLPARAALRKVGELLRRLEPRSGETQDDERERERAPDAPGDSDAGR